MYYVNREQIERRIAALDDVYTALEQVTAAWDGSLLSGMVQERALHLAIECVTDIGSYLIDGFIMRDASSYDDIIEIIRGEQVMDEQTAVRLLELVKLRRPLVQDYYDWPRHELHPLTAVMPDILRGFAQQVSHYLDRELG
ncbi:DUF86 domain-containing protein [Paenibacillus campi]|uniref:DUF86 domain-containing protein n=1 Tax=Paenibacillus campi TaxID=3106031 RepID=UPI002AFE2533|nr:MULTISPECIES: HepT-like ribonuclease domain-containing protein [unclassified Paenibacillus]